MTDFLKTVRIGRKGLGRTQPSSVFVTIRYEDGRLSLTGVEGPFTSGNCAGAAGQIDLNAGAWVDFAPGWDAVVVEKLAAIWDDWHLNDMQAGNPQQMAWLKANPIVVVGATSHYEVATKALDAAGLNPQGDRYGHKWHRVDVPADVLEWLQALPDADQPSAWRETPLKSAS